MALKAAVHKNDGDEHIITWSRTSQMLSDTSDAIAKKHRIKPEVLTFKSIIITR